MTEITIHGPEFCIDGRPTYAVREYAGRKIHGVLAFTFNAQGGGARYNAEVYDHYDNSAFTCEGALKQVYADRFARILGAADALRMIATPHKRVFFERVAEVTGYVEHLRE